MKYIRTKDGVYESDEIRGAIFIRIWLGQKAISRDEIINQSENIEELCDEFVWVDGDTNSHDLIRISCDRTACHLKEEPDYDYDFKYVLKQKFNTIYGAIWTDKGLIYVAKMNEEGELELL